VSDNGVMSQPVITPNRGDSPCVCGYIHPCCRFLVDGGCAHSTPGVHHHAPSQSPDPICACGHSVYGHGFWEGDARVGTEEFVNGCTEDGCDCRQRRDSEPQ
jgi:hypothetical protein